MSWVISTFAIIIISTIISVTLLMTSLWEYSHTIKVDSKKKNPMRNVDDKKWNLATILLILLIILLLPSPFIVSSNSSICVDRFSEFHMSCKMSNENIFKNKTTKRKFTTMKAWQCHPNKQTNIFLYLWALRSVNICLKQAFSLPFTKRQLPIIPQRYMCSSFVCKNQQIVTRRIRREERKIYEKKSMQSSKNLHKIIFMLYPKNKN